MATTSSYGDRPALQGYRRSFTLPARALSNIERAGLDKSDADANVLFSHPAARIIAFTPPKDSLPAPSKEILADTDYPVDAIETLPWRSRTETLASTGPIVIEKVRGSSNFLKSADQKVIHTIMRNSQCWCVDGESKFVLRIGKFRYYRIELPAETEHDKEKVEELKSVLSKILRFERTPCPFKRAFHVDLPEDAITPRRKGPWKRKEVQTPTTPNTDPLPLRRTKNSRAWSLQGQTTPIQAYGRRGSDYGYTSSRASSPFPPPDYEDYRPGTPSSLAYSDYTNEKDPEDESTQDVGDHEESLAAQADDGLVNSTPPLAPNSVVAPMEGPPEPSNEKHEDLVEQQNIASDEEVHVLPEVTDNSEDPEATSHSSLAQKQEESLPLPASEEPQEHSTVDESKDKAPDVELASEVPPSVALTEGLAQENADAQQGETHAPEAVQSDGISNSNEKAEVYIDSLQGMPREEHDQVVESLSITTAVQDSGPEQSQSDPTEDNVSTVPATTEATETADDEMQDDDALSRVSSADSFHTTSSLTEVSFQDLDPEKSPPGVHFEPFSIPLHQHRRELSELTVTASTVDDSIAEWNDLLRPSQKDTPRKPSTPGLEQSPRSEMSWPEVRTPPSPVVQDLRQRLRKKRSLSPLPPPSTVFSPPQSSPSQGNHFTAAILQKACNVAVVKPIEAVVLLVHILARIAGGATVNDLLSGDLFRRPDRHRRGSSFPDRISSPQHDTDDEDDFGVPIHHGRRRSSSEAPTPAAPFFDDTNSIFDLD